MAVNLLDKGLYQPPQGLATSSLDELPVDVEFSLEGDEPVVEVEIEEESDFYENLAESLPEEVLEQIASELETGINDDLRARKDWEKIYTEGINLLGLKYETRTEPWQGACGVFHPMIMEAVIRFQADTVMETFPSSGPVKTQIVGKVTEDKEKAAKRVSDDLNWQLMENMPEFRSEHERMLFNLPGTGCAFKKVYDCPTLNRQTSVFVPAEDIIIPYGTTDLLTCERIAHRMKKTKLETAKLQESGFWRDVDLPEPQVMDPNDIQKKKDKETGMADLLDTRHVFYEVSVELDLDAMTEGDESAEEAMDSGGAKPYIVTFLDKTKKVVALRRNWKEQDDLAQKRLHFVMYTYIPGYGAYGFGLFHLLGGFATSATSIMRQLVDAGTLSNLSGGLKSKGLRIKGDDQPISPGEFRDVDVGSGTIRDNILPLPYKEPSATLYQLLLNIVEEGRRFASTNDLKVADMSSQAPVGTTLAVLERQLRTMTAVQARVHFSFKQELRLLADIIKEDAEEGDNPDYDYDVDAPDGSKAKLEDYSYVSIIPVSDPNSATMSQRVVQYQAVVQLAQMAPDIYDMPALHRQMLNVLGIKNIGELVPTEEDIRIVDPVQENQNIIALKPVKAIAWQDHESHIQVHMAMAKDPLVQQMVGQNPKASQIMAAMAAHVSEHVGFAYRNKMSLAMGRALPVLEKTESLPQEVEVQLSRMMAQAAPIVMQQSQQMAAQQQAQKNAQDPVLVAQRMEQETARMEVERKKAKDQADNQIEQARLSIDAKSKGIDPQQLQAEMQMKMQKQQQELSLAQQRMQQQAQVEQQRLQMQAQKDAEQTRLQQQQAQTNAAQAQQRIEQERKVSQDRAMLDAAAKRQQMINAEEKHNQDKAIKASKHRADLAAKKQAVAQKKEEPKK